MAKDWPVANCCGWLLALIDSPALKLCSVHLVLRRILLKVQAISAKLITKNLPTAHMCTIKNLSLYFISPGDPAINSPSILKKFNVKPHKNATCMCMYYCVFNQQEMN